mmetsp:Transcript_115642/g.247134  ORF Transcript_115642/g.247134 Transcript_115642/m.247134 type:complete len:248 (-) Transcript_115642:662-1405(-)
MESPVEEAAIAPRHAAGVPVPSKAVDPAAAAAHSTSQAPPVASFTCHAPANVSKKASMVPPEAWRAAAPTLSPALAQAHSVRAPVTMRAPPLPTSLPPGLPPKALVPARTLQESSSTISTPNQMMEASCATGGGVRSARSGPSDGEDSGKGGARMKARWGAALAVRPRARAQEPKHRSKRSVGMAVRAPLRQPGPPPTPMAGRGVPLRKNSSKLATMLAAPPDPWAASPPPESDGDEGRGKARPPCS